MNSKSSALFALLIPGLLMLAACDRKPDADDAAAAPVAVTPAPAPETPAAMPADTMPAAAMAGTEMSFADMDKNHDGALTKDEMPATEMLSQHFSVADADGDGKLSDAEVMKHRADMAAGK